MRRTVALGTVIISLFFASSSAVRRARTAAEGPGREPGAPGPERARPLLPRLRLRLARLHLENHGERDDKNKTLLDTIQNV